MVYIHVVYCTCMLLASLHTHTHTLPEVTEGHVEGAVSILKKYIAMLHKHATLSLSLATQVASISLLHFSSALAILQSGPCGQVIPELAVGMVLLLLRVPLQLTESDCIPMLGQLVEMMDVFNRLAPEACQEDREDLSWAESMLMSLQHIMCIIMIF